MRVTSRRVPFRVNDIGGIERREEHVRGNTFSFFLTSIILQIVWRNNVPSMTDMHACTIYIHVRQVGLYRCTEVQRMHFCSLLSLRNMNLSHFQESAFNWYIFNILIINCMIIINCYRVNRIFDARNAADISCRFEERRKKEKKCRKRN